MENYNLYENNEEDFEALLRRIMSNQKKTFEERLRRSRDIHDFATKSLNVYEEVVRKDFKDAQKISVSETLDITDEVKRKILDCELFIDNQIHVQHPGEKHSFVLNNSYRVLTVDEEYPTSITITKEGLKKPCEFYGLSTLSYFTTVFWDDFWNRPKEVIVIKEPLNIIKGVYSGTLNHRMSENRFSKFFSIPVDQEALEDMIVLRKSFEEVGGLPDFH